MGVCELLVKSAQGKPTQGLKAETVTHSEEVFVAGNIQE